MIERERQSREAVWIELSKLFLDTELQPQDYDEIAAVLAASPYSIDELEVIVVKEVAPLCLPNLCTTAGEWQGFDPELVKRSCAANSRPGVLLKWWVRTMFWKGLVRYFTSHHLRELALRIAATREAAR